jgi:hypothetical protein
MEFYIVHCHDARFRLGYLPTTNWEELHRRHLIILLAPEVTLFNGDVLVNDFATLEDASAAWHTIEGGGPPPGSPT